MAEEKTGMSEEVQKKWDESVGAFATAVGKEAKEIEDALAPLIGEPSEDALGSLMDRSILSDEEIQGGLKDLSIPVAKFRKNITVLRGPEPEPDAAVPDDGVAMSVTMDVLPTAPDDSSFLELLKTGGDLKIGQTEVVSAIRASLAHRAGLYELPKVVAAAMEEFSKRNENPCGPEYYELLKMAGEKNYAEVLNILGVKGSFVTQKRINELLSLLDVNFWGAIHGFQEQLKGWQKTWMEGFANPAAMFGAMAAINSGNVAPPGMTDAPPTDVLKDEAESVINAINRVFAGSGIPVARALAWDASRIKKLLENDKLPAAIGAADRDQMLKMLDVNVSADYVRLERSIVRYVMAIMEYPKTDPGRTEQIYLSAMLQLGNTIKWSALLGEGSKGSGSRRF